MNRNDEAEGTNGVDRRSFITKTLAAGAGVAAWLRRKVLLRRSLSRVPAVAGNRTPHLGEDALVSGGFRGGYGRSEHAPQV
jgi:hypothetical protein